MTRLCTTCDAGFQNNGKAEIATESSADCKLTLSDWELSPWNSADGAQAGWQVVETVGRKSAVDGLGNVGAIDEAPDALQWIDGNDGIGVGDGKVSVVREMVKVGTHGHGICV